MHQSPIFDKKASTSDDNKLGYYYILISDKTDSNYNISDF